MGEEIMTDISQEPNIAEIQNIDQLENTLKNYSETVLALSAETDNQKMLACLLQAQLSVISVAKDPTLCKSAFALIIQSLSDANEELSDETELRNFQKCAALMTNNMIFFFDAYLYYQDDRNSKESQKLLHKACDTLAKTANDIFEEMRKNPAVCATTAALAVVSGEKLFENVMRDCLLQKIIDAFFNSKRLGKFRNDYFDFLESVFVALNRHHRLFGKSVVIAEMIHGKKTAIAEHRHPLPYKPEKRLMTKILVALIIFCFVCAIILLLQGLINLSPANLDEAVNTSRIAMICGGIAVVVVVIIHKAIYPFSVKRRRKRKELALAEIADLF